MCPESTAKYCGAPRPRISILGDSISTYHGFTAEDGLFYDAGTAQDWGLSSVEDTWWMQVIRRLDGKLEVNNSFSGSQVCGDDPRAASSAARTGALGNPDMILIYMGLNDGAAEVPVPQFLTAYRRMLRRLRTEYPHARIYGGTLCRGVQADVEEFSLSWADRAMPLDSYNQAIRDAVAAENCFLADLAAKNCSYETLDGSHPTRSGMTLLADLWLDFLC